MSFQSRIRQMDLAVPPIWVPPTCHLTGARGHTAGGGSQGWPWETVLASVMGSEEVEGGSPMENVSRFTTGEQETLNTPRPGWISHLPRWKLSAWRGTERTCAECLEVSRSPGGPDTEPSVQRQVDGPPQQSSLLPLRPAWVRRGCGLQAPLERASGLPSRPSRPLQIPGDCQPVAPSFLRELWTPRVSWAERVPSEALESHRAKGTNRNGGERERRTRARPLCRTPAAASALGGSTILPVSRGQVGDTHSLEWPCALG